MRKTILFLSWLILCAGSASAVPMKGPYFLKQGQIEVGVEANFVARRDIEDITTNIQSSQFFYCMAFGLFDWLNIEAKYGSGDIKNDQYYDQKFYYNYNWGGGYGLRIKAYENHKMKIILGAHHISIHPDPNKNTDNSTHRVILDETQSDITLSLKGERFSPYAGAKVGHTRLIRRINSERATLRSEENYGFALGFDYMFKENVRFNFEGRFIDEYALTSSVSYIF